MKRMAAIFCLCFLGVLASGCALHYYDEETKTEHIWGFGHMKMKVAAPSEGLQAVVHGTDVLGVGVGRAYKNNYFTVGWHRLEFIEIMKESTSVRVEGPKGDFLNLRVGSKFPLEPTKKKQ